MGIAISTGAAIAQEIADITVSSEDLMALVTLRQLSCALMARIHRNYRFVIGFNCSLIGLGLIGILPPHHQRPAAQYVNPWHRHEEHDESAVIKRKLFPGRAEILRQSSAAAPRQGHITEVYSSFKKVCSRPWIIAFSTLFLLK